MAKEKPILFCTDMVRAILEDRKSQTRRVVKGKRDKEYGGGPSRVHLFSTIRQINGIWYGCDSDGLPFINDPIQQPCKPGDILWVRETFADIIETAPGNLHYKADATKADLEWFKKEGRKWKPSIHMPREAARIFLKVTNVWPERVQDISEEDAKAEGVTPINDSECGYRGAFRELWNALNAKRGYDWYTNNWVWVYTFERMEINLKEAGKPAATYAHQQILKEA